MSIDRRNPCRDFDSGLISGFLGTRTLEKATRFSKGKSNTNYKLQLSDGLICVLRLFSHKDMNRELFLMALAGDIVPVPRELYRGTDWAICTFIEGRCLSEVPEYTAAAVSMINQLASHTFPAPGEIKCDGTVSAFPFGGISGYIHQQLQADTVRHWLGERKSAKIFETVITHAAIYSELESHACLVHGDFNPENILIHKGKVSGILDWEHCHSGTPYMDLGNLLRHTPRQYHRDIEIALSASDSEFTRDWIRRAKLVDVTSHLEFLSSGRADAFKRECVNRIDRFIDEFG